MENSMITQVINRFNNLIDSLIEDFKEYKLDEQTIVFLAEKTRNFIDFSQVALFNVVFGILKKLENAGFSVDNEISQAENLINKIFENINNSLDNILPDEDEEQEVHEHDHHHQHHHHVDVDAVQEDIDKIIANLQMLKKLIANLAEMVVLTLKYQAEEISDVLFKKEYDKFKENIKDFGQDFEKKE